MEETGKAFICDHHAHGQGPHSLLRPDEIVDEALSVELSGVVILAHFPLTGTKKFIALYELDRPRPRMTKHSDVQTFLNMVKDLKRKKPQEKVEVIAGLEFDHIVGREKINRDFIQEMDSNILRIGSIHYILTENKKFHSLEASERWWRKVKPERAQEKYYQYYAEMAKSGLYHVGAHFNLFDKRNLKPLSTGRPHSLYEEALQAVQENGMFLEINTGPLSNGNGLGNFCPDLEILHTMRKMDFERIVLSSDAHEEGAVGRNFILAMMVLKRMGFDKFYNFRLNERGVLEPQAVSIDAALEYMKRVESPRPPYFPMQPYVNSEVKKVLEQRNIR